MGLRTRFEVDEDRAAVRIENVAVMRFAVQQLLASTAAGDRPPRPFQRVHEQRPIGFSESRRHLSVGDQPLGLCDTLREMRSRDVQFSHADVQAP